MAAKMKLSSQRLAKCRREIALKESQLIRFRKRCAAEATEEAGRKPVTIKVMKKIHEGTVVNVMGFLMPVKESVEKGGTFLLDMEEWKVKLCD